MSEKRFENARRVLVVLGALLFFGGIGYTVWDVTSTRIARERTIPEKVFSRATPTREDFQRAEPLTAKQKKQVEYWKKQYQKKLAAWKAAGSKGNMPYTIIPRGTTGQADSFGVGALGNSPIALYEGYFQLDSYPSGSYLRYNNLRSDGDSNNPEGWQITTGGQVTVPSNVPEGDYQVTIATGDIDPYTTGPANIFRFTVSAFAVNLTNVEVNTCAGGVSCDATAVGGTDPVEMRFLIDNVQEQGWATGRNQSFSKGSSIAAGSHTLKVEARDSSTPQLTASDSDSFNMPASLENEVAGSPNPALPNSTVEFTSMPSGGTPPYSYEWPGGETTPAVSYQTGSTAGFLEASCIVTDSEGCTAEATGSVIVEDDGGDGGSGGNGGGSGGSGSSPPNVPGDGNPHTPPPDSGGGLNPWPGTPGTPPVIVEPPQNQPPGTSPPPSGSNPPIIVTPPNVPGQPPTIVVPPSTAPGTIGGVITVPLPGGGSTTIPVVIVVVPPTGYYWDGDSYELLPPSGDPCCKAGYVYIAEIKACVLPAWEIPTTPGAPLFVSKDCETGAAIIQSPAWNATPQRPITHMTLYRVNPNGSWATVGQLGSANATLPDNEVESPFEYSYYVRAFNEKGHSGLSSALVVDMASPLALEFIAPEHTTLYGIETIAIKATGDLDVEEAHLFYGGSELLQLKQSAADPKVFYTEVDTSADIWQGPVLLSAYVVDENGCRTPAVEIERNLNNTLANSVMYEEITLEKERAIAGVEASAHLLPLDGVTDSYIEFGTYNAPPESHPLGENPTDEAIDEAEAEWPYAQKIRLATREKLVDLLTEGGDTQEPTDTVVLRVRKTPIWRPSRFATSATPTRFIKVSDSEVLVVALPKIYTLSATNGWSEKYDLASSALALPNAVDVDFRADKIFAVENNRIVALDVPKNDAGLDFGAAHQVFSPVGETKSAKFARYLPTGDMMALVYSDNANTTLYILRADQSKQVVNFAAPTLRVAAAGKWLALADANTIRIYEAGTTTAPVVYTHDHELTFVQVDENKNLIFGDDRGDGFSDVYLLEADETEPLLRSTRAFLTRAYATQGGPQSDPYGAIGGDNPQLFQEKVQGVNVLWNGTENFGTGAKIHALHRMTMTSGGMTFESLLMAVEKAGGHFVARLEKAVKPALAYEASGNVPYVVFAATSYF